jgi:hypothetical protein
MNERIITMKRVRPEREVLGEDLRPNYRLKTDPVIRITAEEIPLNYPPEVLNEWAKEERDAIIRRKKIFNEKPEFFNEVERIDIDKINDEFSPWNLFEWPTKIDSVNKMLPHSFSLSLKLIHKFSIKKLVFLIFKSNFIKHTNIIISDFAVYSTGNWIRSISKQTAEFIPTL